MSQSPLSGQPPNGQPQPKKSGRPSEGERIALITLCGTVLVAIITYILAPVVVARISPAALPTPTTNLVSSTNSTLSASVTPSATSSSLPAQNPYPPYAGVTVLNNSLYSSTPDWEESSPYSTDPGSCAFLSQAYYASQPQAGYFTTCLYRGFAYANFAFEVGMTIVQGDCGGIFFDADTLGKHFYYFRLCQKDGSYVLNSTTNNKKNQTIAYAPGCPAFKTGPGQFNRIAVDVQGHGFDLYVNGQKLANTWNSSYNLSYDQGFIGVLADNLGLQTTVAFNDARVWKW